MKLKKNANESIQLIIKKVHNSMSLTREVTRHVRNARGGPLISVFGVFCSLGESHDVT